MTGQPAPRYAIYFMPEPSSALWAYGSRVLGYDAMTGQDMLQPEPEFASWTADPRRYGFHATLKAPFSLRNDATESGLVAAARRFAAQRLVFEADLELSILGRFIALTNVQPCEPLARLAGDCVRYFDEFRAPLSAEDRERRLNHVLPPRQTENLERWGYPYVFEDFTFHMTLSNSLDAGPRANFMRTLGEIPLDHRQVFDAISIFIQPGPEARFRVLERVRFGG